MLRDANCASTEIRPRAKAETARSDANDMRAIGRIDRMMDSLRVYGRSSTWVPRVSGTHSETHADYYTFPYPFRLVCSTITSEGFDPEFGRHDVRRRVRVTERLSSMTPETAAVAELRA